MQVHVQTLVVAVAAPALALAADQGTTQRDEGFRGAVTAPLEDLNIKQADIPPVLVRAMAGPYDMQGFGRCEALAAEVGRLDAALGPDLDEAPPPDRRTTGQKIAAQAKAAAVGEVKGQAQDLLPFRGWVRKLSGAERHRKALDGAIKAGGVRRGYLKGVGMRMNCAPPAAPSWFVPKPPEPPKSWYASLWNGVTAWLRALLGKLGL